MATALTSRQSGPPDAEVRRRFLQVDAKRLLYQTLYSPTALLATMLFSLRFTGRRHVPRQGGLLVIANHQSALDPPLLGVVIPRRLRYLARKTLFKPRPFAWFIEALGAVPLNQESGGTEGLKTAIRLLRAGEAVVIFPEGARTPDGILHPLKPGVVALIRRAMVPVLPVGIAGAFEAWPIHKYVPRLAPLFLGPDEAAIGIAIGRPIAAETLKPLPPEAMLSLLHQRLVELRDEAERIRNRPRGRSVTTSVDDDRPGNK